MSKGAQFYLLVLATAATTSLTVMGVESYSHMRCLAAWSDHHSNNVGLLGDNAIGAAVHACNGGASSRF